MREFLIDGLWIVENYSGVCLFEENYADFKKDGISKDLITGFLSAIVSFAEEAFRDDLQYIKFANHKIVLRFTPYVLIIIAVSLETPDIDIHINKTIDIIVEKFNKKFNSTFEKDKWAGDVEMFENFSEDLKQIIKREPLTLKLIMLEKIRRKERKRDERRKRLIEEAKRSS